MKNLPLLLRTCCLLLAVLLLPCLFAVTSAQAKPEKLVVYSWSDYIPQSVLDQFTKETGIKVVNATFESNEAMYIKVKLMKGKGYDVILPSTYFIDLMANEGLLAKLDHKQLPNLSNLDPALMDQPYDPNNQYSVPFMWGSAGLMFNSKHIDPASISGWKDLLKPEFKGKVILSDDMRDSIGMALKAKGHSANTVDPAELEDAYDFLKALKPSVRVFDVTASKQAFVSEEVLIGMIWNGDAILASRENPDLRFVYPEEGLVLWVDNFGITSASENKENAHKFINFMLRPDIAAACVEAFPYSTPNLEARKLLPQELQESRVAHPLPEDLKNSEFVLGVGKSLSGYEKLWEKVKTNR